MRVLHYRADHEPVYMEGVSDAALGRIGEFLARAESADPSCFDPPPDGDGHSRKSLRYLCALISPKADDMVDEVHALLANPGMERWRLAHILGEGGVGVRGEYSGWLLRLAGSMLRRGITHEKVIEQTGMAKRRVAELATFLGSTEAQQDALWERALRFIEREEVNPYLFVAETGVSLARAKALLRQVRDGLEQE